MSDLFLPPPFDADDTLVPILGRAPTGTRAATLADLAPRRDPEGVGTALAPTPGARTPGLLLAATGDARARLDFAMTALGAVAVPVTVRVDGADRPAEAYAFAATPPETAGPPTGGERARLAEALVEIMAHYGRRAAAEMPFLVHGIGIRALGRVRARQRTVPPVLGSGLSIADVEPVARDFAYAHYFGVEEHRLRHRRFDGGLSDVIGRGVFTSGDAVSLLPFDPHHGTVLMIEQFRAGPYARRDPRPWSLEPPAGRADRADEPLEETARREAREEAGLEIGRIEKVAEFYPSPGIMSEYITSFVGEADLGGAGGVFGLAEEHEDIRALVVPLADALAACATGEINTAPLILTLYWLDRHAGRLRDAWL